MITGPYFISFVHLKVVLLHHIVGHFKVFKEVSSWPKRFAVLSLFALDLTAVINSEYLLY
jgi:hypothetical protein